MSRAYSNPAERARLLAHQLHMGTIPIDANAIIAWNGFCGIAQCSIDAEESLTAFHPLLRLELIRADIDFLHDDRQVWLLTPFGKRVRNEYRALKGR